MRKIKVLLVYPSALYAPEWGIVTFQKAHMADLFSFLRENGVEVACLDLEQKIGRPKNEEEVESFRKKTVGLLSVRDFDIIAISCWTSLNYLSSVMVAQISKQVNDKSVVVVGGYHPTAVTSDFVYQKSPFDFIVRGEGEEALSAICQGKMKKDKGQKIIQGIPLALTTPRFPLSYGTFGPHRNSNVAEIYLSRGCPFSCNFCMERTKRYGVWRSYSVDHALAILRRLSDSPNLERIVITDACFGYNKNWRRDFLFKLIKNRIKQELWVETRIDLIEKEDVDLFAKLNSRVDFGLESGSATMLHIMGKTKNPKKYLKKCEEIVTYMNRRGVSYKLFFIFNHPGETCATYVETLRFIESLITRHKTISGRLGFQNYAFFPGSHVHAHLKHYEEEYGTIVKHRRWWKEKRPHHPLATSVIASRSLMLKFGETNTYWHEGAAAIIEKVIKKNKRLLSFARSGNYSPIEFI